jgi:hypothetical protein
MKDKSIFRVDREDKELAPFIDLIEGEVLTKSDISLLTLHTNLLIENSRNEYKRGYSDGYYEGKGVTNNIVCTEAKVKIERFDNIKKYLRKKKKNGKK